MKRKDSLWSLGLMSGTSLDGVDAALIKTDGTTIDHFGPSTTVLYPESLRRNIRSILGGVGPVERVEREITDFHAEVALTIFEDSRPIKPDLVGFHGHTILHRPQEGKTWQIGDGALLSRKLTLPVINDFRSADVQAGGQGAPLVPVFHQALAQAKNKPIAFVNLGGVANVTWLGHKDQMIAFDTGPGNALLDDWILHHTGQAYDEEGRIAAKGKVSEAIIERFLSLDYFSRLPPKSLDRDDFSSIMTKMLSTLTLEDGAATLCAMTVASIVHAQKFFPQPVSEWFICGGGRHNKSLMLALQSSLVGKVMAVESAGWDGDALEAQAFAFLAVRSLYDMPLSWPSTTGVPLPQTGGCLFKV